MRRLARFMLPAAILAAAALPAAPAVAAGPCPGQYLVYQPAPAGPIKLGAGSYTIQVLNYSCASASDELSSFIGHDELPAPWTAIVRTRTFVGKGGSFSLEFTRSIDQAPSQALRCPSFSVLDGERVGSVALPSGQYAVSTGGEEPLGCLAAGRLLVQIVDGPDGDLPGAWTAADPSGPRAGVVLRHESGRSVQVRWLHGRTAGGGHTPPGSGR